MMGGVRHAARPARSRDSAAGDHVGFLARSSFTSLAAACDWARRCECRAGPGSSSAPNPMALPPSSPRSRSSSRVGSLDSCTGILCGPVHEVMFRGCCGALPPPPSTEVPQMNVGDPLPTLRGEFLTGRTALLPQAAAGRVASPASGLQLRLPLPPSKPWARPNFREQSPPGPARDLSMKSR